MSLVSHLPSMSTRYSHLIYVVSFSHLVTILDDSEFYESGEPFAQHEYALLGTFVNQFLYRAIWGGAVLGKSLFFVLFFIID
jgi:hypothetical protein